MEWEFIAPMIFSSVLVLSIAAVIILRPLSKRLGNVLERMQEQRSASDSDDLRRIARLLEGLDERVDRLEHRQDFTERMLSPSEGEETVQREPSRKPGDSTS